jgi:hypothetical protein
MYLGEKHYTYIFHLNNIEKNQFWYQILRGIVKKFRYSKNENDRANFQCKQL